MNRLEVREYMRGKRGALLIRESSDPQLQMFGPVQQQRIGDRSAREAEMPPVVKVYTVVQSGTNIFGNDAFRQILADAKDDVFDVLFIAYASRFARDLHDGLVLLHQLVALGKAVYFCQEDVLCGFERGWMKRIGHELVESHAYSDELSRQIEESIRSRWDSGIVHTRPGFGYATEGRPKRLIKDERIVGGRAIWQWRAWMYEEYDRGEKTLTQVADALSAAGLRTSRGFLFNKTDVYRILTHPLSRGLARYHAGMADEESRQHDELRVVSDDLFERVSGRLRSRGRRRRSPARAVHTHVFAELAVCSLCGSGYTYRVQVATGYSGLHHPLARKGERCRFTPVPCVEKTLMAALGSYFREIDLPADAVALVEQFLRERPEDRSAANTRTRLELKLKRAQELYLEGDLTKARWLEMRELTQRQLSDLPRTAAPPDPNSVEVLTNIGRVWAIATPTERRQLAELILERVSIGCDERKLALYESGASKRIREGATVVEIVVRPAYRDLVNLGLAAGQPRQAEQSSDSAYVGQVAERPLYATSPTYMERVSTWRRWLDAHEAA